MWVCLYFLAYLERKHENTKLVCEAVKEQFIHGLSLSPDVLSCQPMGQAVNLVSAQK